jgi:O-antigen/teichoic acid export membrane protein
MDQQQKQRSSLTVQAFWLLIAKTLAFMLAFALPMLLTRTLSQSEYGLFKQVFLIVTTATAFLPLGFGMSAFYYLPREQSEKRRGQVILNILLFNLLMGAVACLVLVFWPGLIGKIFQDATVQRYSALVGAVILVWLFSAFLEIVAVANQELRLATVFIVFGQLSRTVLLLAAAIVFDSVTALIYAALIHGILQSLVLLWYVSSRFPHFWRAFDWSLTGKQVAYALPFGFAGLLYTVQTDAHNYVVSHNFSPAIFAIYSIGVAQVPLIGVLRDSVSSVILPRISYLQEQGQTRQILVLMASAVRKLAAFYLPMYFVLLITGREFLTFMFTSRYLQSWPIFAINLTLLPISLIEMDAVIRAYEKHRFFLVIVQLVMSLLMIVAVWFGVTRFGLVGAISAVVVVNFLMRIVLAGRFSRVLGAKWRDISLFKDLGKVVVASGLAALVCFLVHSMVAASNTRPFYVVVICGLVFCAVYLPAIILLRIPTTDEWDKLRSGVGRVQQFVYLRRSADSVP